MPQAPVAHASIPARAGVGLRAPHHAAVLAAEPGPAWVEVHTENYFHDGGPAVRALERVRARCAVSLHCVGLGLGSVTPLDRDHLRRVRTAVERFQPGLVSDHACWSHGPERHHNDLLPLPQTEEAVEHLAARVREVQDFLGRQLLVENLSAYVAYGASRLSEGQFLAALVERSGCGLLLDVNNAYVNQHNLGLDVERFFAELPRDAVREIHLAGHARRATSAGELLIDDHGSAVSEEVWRLYAAALRRFGPVPTLVEWDTDIPPLATLLAEAARADRLLAAVHDAAA